VELANLRTSVRQDMKKWIIGISALLILTIACIYIFIPEKMVVSKLMTAKVTIDGAARFLSDEKNWEKWWRDEHSKVHEKGKPYSFNTATYQLTSFRDKGIGIQIRDQGLTINSLISLVTLTKDSTLIFWQCEIPGSNNPIYRISKYYQAVTIKKNMSAIIKNFCGFIADPENIYAFQFRRESTNDTLLLSARFKTDHYPSTSEIYNYLSLIEQNIKKQKATVVGFPLLHVNKIGDGNFEVQLALPTSKWLKDDDIFFSRRMVKGYFIIGDVTGGPDKVSLAEDQLGNYVSDYGKTRIAIPFQRLVTNRMIENDSSKWHTQVFMPVME